MIPFLVYLGVGLITFTAFLVDKKSAAARGRRIPEATLHLLELLGGWPGALIAIRFLRHKSSKPRYYLVTWLIAALHGAGWTTWLLLK